MFEDSNVQSLEQEHRELDGVVAKLSRRPSADQFKIKELKKQKLQLKDKIAHLQS